jgi:uncharacterized protein YndB with AHSA1/START domain
MEKTMTEQQRLFEYALDIDASPGEVWKALTEADELMRWFPLRAEVTPGVGGTMVWAWDESWDWTTRIDAWEPGRLLRLVQDDYQPAPDAAPARVAMEFTLETRAGKTRLRLVHSGFGRGAAWDNELDGISEGWPAELGSLRLYLERHRGRDRQVGRATASLMAPLSEVWATLTGPGGFRLSPADPKVGDRFTVTAPTGDRFSGTVEASLPARALTGIVPDLDHGLFRLATWRDAAGKAGAWVSLATYGEDTGRAAAFGERAQEALRRLFPQRSGE